MSTDVNDVSVPADREEPEGAGTQGSTTETPPTGGHEEATELDRLAEERDALRDRLLRTAAEFDNYRKRVDRERRDASERAAEGVLSELLPILDDLERALAAEASDEAAMAYRRGVELIHRQLLELLTRRGVKPVETVGHDFDPHLHQAVTTESNPEYRDGEIIQELRRGYLLGDRLLRPAMVKVAQA
jgi:molecular chaperone GrpE